MSAVLTEPVRRLGLLDYEDAVALQQELVEQRWEGEIPNTLLLLEHPPTITLGRGADSAHLLADAAELAANGVHLAECARGGDVTWHGPGQLVGYAIVDLRERDRDVHRFLRDLEAMLIEVLAGFDVAGRTEAGRTGVWVGEGKIAAIGVAVRRWVTWHGFALNVSSDLAGFEAIVPCGLHDRGVTSLEQVLGRKVALDDVADRVAAEFVKRFSGGDGEGR